MRRQHAAQPQRRQARVGDSTGRIRWPRRRPRSRARRGFRTDPRPIDLGAQLVEIEPLHQRRRERARAVEEEAAAVGGRRLGQDEIDDDLALRRQQRGKAGPRRRHLGDVAGDQPVEEFARVVAGNLDDAAVGKQRCFHDGCLIGTCQVLQPNVRRSRAGHKGGGLEMTQSSDHDPRRRHRRQSRRRRHARHRRDRRARRHRSGRGTPRSRQSPATKNCQVPSGPIPRR